MYINYIFYIIPFWITTGITHTMPYNNYFYFILFNFLFIIISICYIILLLTTFLKLKFIKLLLITTFLKLKLIKYYY